MPHYSTTKTFMKLYTGWMDLLRNRAKVRFDGVYICKIVYFKKGETEKGWYPPFIEVTSYKWVWLKRNGEAR